MRKTSKLNKKGMEMQTVTTVILGALILALLIVVIGRIYENSKEKLEIQECKDSIAAHALLARTTQREVFTDITCQTRELSIDAKNHNKAKKEIAEDMRRCWYEWLRGDAQLFKGEGIFCHVCSIYNFKQKDDQIGGFPLFLLTEDIDIRSVYPEDTIKMKYIQYFQSYTSKQQNEIENSPTVNKQTFTDATVIDTSKKYATIFVYASGKEDIQKFMEGGYRTSALVGGGIVAGLGVTAIGTAFIVSNPVGWFVGGALAIGAGAYAIYEAVTPKEPQWLSVIQLIEYDDQTIKDLGCQYLAVNQLSHQQP